MHNSNKIKQQFMARVLFMLMCLIFQNCNNLATPSLVTEKEEGTNTEAIVFCGNPGVGKSALCNSVFQEAKFVSGRSKGTGITKVHQHYMYANKLYIDTPGLEDVDMRQQAAAEIEEALKKDKNYKIVFIVTLESGRVRMGDLTSINVVCDAIKTQFEYGLIVNKCSEEVIDDIIQEGGLGPYLTTLHKQLVRTIMLTRDSGMDDKPNMYFKAHDENRRKLLDFINTLPASTIQKKNVNKIDVSNFEGKIQEMEKGYAKAVAEQEARHKQEREEQEVRMGKERAAYEAKVRKIQEQMQESQQAAEAKIEEERKKTENKISEIREEYEKKQRILEAQRQKEKEEHDAQIKRLQEKIEEEQQIAKAQRQKEKEEQEVQIKILKKDMKEKQRVAEAENKKESKEEKKKLKKEKKKFKNEIKKIRQEARAQRKREKEEQEDKFNAQMKRMQEQMEEIQRAAEAQSKKEREEAEDRIKKIQQKSKNRIKRIQQENEDRMRSMQQENEVRYLNQLSAQPSNQLSSYNPMRDAAFSAVGGGVGGPVGAGIGLVISQFMSSVGI